MRQDQEGLGEAAALDYGGSFHPLEAPAWPFDPSPRSRWPWAPAPASAWGADDDNTVGALADKRAGARLAQVLQATLP